MHAHPDFVLARRINAPLDRVWRAWTERDRLLKWFSPSGMTMTNGDLDLRGGGSFHYALATPEGGTIWGLWSIRGVTPRRRLVMDIQFSDAQRGVTRHPGHAQWPLHTLATVTFEDVGDDETIVTVHWNALDATAEEQTAFDHGHEDMRHGWGGTFGQLEAYLRTST